MAKKQCAMNSAKQSPRTDLGYKRAMLKGFDSDNSDNVVRSLEDKIRRGVFHIPPPILDGAKKLQ